MTHLRNTILIVVALVATMLYTVASASARPAPNADNGFAPATPPPVIPHVTSSGLAPWTVVLIAVAAGFVTRRFALQPPPTSLSLPGIAPLVLAPVTFVLGGW